ncbi:MAG: hypothetical protein DWI59_01875 [Chloroflexi bacterium]|nr:MAG: hypothetical protein DWI59_01875 [Chloroflexota bacterium]
MNSGMIGKVEKAHRYVAEPERFAFNQLEVVVRGDNSEHRVSLDGGQWTCNCDFFAHQQACAHTMSIELLLRDMLPSTTEAAPIS